MAQKRTTVLRIHQIGCRNVRQFHEFTNLELLAAPGCFWRRSCRSLAVPSGSWLLLAALLAAPGRSWHVLAAFWRSFAVASASWRSLAAPLAAFLIALLAALGSGRSWLRSWPWPRIDNSTNSPIWMSKRTTVLRNHQFGTPGCSWLLLAALLPVSGASRPLLAAFLVVPGRSWHVLAAFLAVLRCCWRFLAVFGCAPGWVPECAPGCRPLAVPGGSLAIPGGSSLLGDSWRVLFHVTC